MVASPYTIRNYLPSDFDNLISFFQKESSSSTLTPQRISDWLAWPGFTPVQDLFIVEIASRIVGYMNLRPELGIDRVILNCRLHHEHQRKGLSAVLLECAIRRAREIGAKFAHVDVMENNTIARKALEKHGFSPARQYYELKLALSHVDWQEAVSASKGCRHLLP